VVACDGGGASVDPTPVSTSTTQPSPAEVSDGVYRLGVLLPADDDPLGQALRGGVNLATQAINEAGGRVAGLPLEVVTREEPADPAEAIDAVESMIVDDRIDALVGPASSRNALAALETVVSNELLTCSPTATAIELSEFADSGYFVRTIGSDRLLADAMAQAIDGLGISRATVLFPYDDYGVDVADALRRDLDERDIIDVDLVNYSVDSQVPDVVDAALADAPQAIGLIGNVPSGAQVLAELRSRLQGARIPTVVSDGLRSPEVATAVDATDPTAVDGVEGVSPASEPESWISNTLRELEPDRPVAYASYAYDCVNLLALAAEVAGADDPAQARAEIVDVSRGGFGCARFADCRDELGRGANIDYDGASGPLDLNDEGDVTFATYDLFEFRNGIDVNSEALVARV
jgi:branched-chain amino acid transport system substrate-binding protein